MPNQKPIIFSKTMVQAILDGRKTQTRRVMKPQPSWIASPDIPFASLDCDPKHIINPYVKRGDTLWVRETWAGQHRFDHLPPRLIPVKTNIHYAATEDLGGLMKRPSIFMPRWAARIFLKVTSVRVERVQDISDEDAKAEGMEAVSGNFPLLPVRRALHYHAFADLWDSINAKRGFGWDVNPWVWVYEFEKVEAPDAESK